MNAILCVGDPDYKRFIPGNPVNLYFIWPENHDQVLIHNLDFVILLRGLCIEVGVLQLLEQNITLYYYC